MNDDAFESEWKRIGWPDGPNTKEQCRHFWNAGKSSNFCLEDFDRLLFLAKHHYRIATSRPGTERPYYLLQDTLNGNRSVTHKADWRYDLREAIDAARTKVGKS